ncbi:hypothetical protein [Gordonibacter urolithinfaciens]|uniref:hypothetical protein n=1 Tax=Gordonibacter urolithinfaciens TaxID=1335613 RepID=UPI003A95264B
MRGRKPKAAAARRGGSDGAAIEVRDGSARMTAFVASNPALAATWVSLFGDGSAFKASDEQAMESLAWWTQALHQLQASMTYEDGSIDTMEHVEGDDGLVRSRPRPTFAQAKQANDMVMKLSDQLGISPLGRARMGVAQAAAGSAALDISKRIAEAMERRESAPVEVVGEVADVQD